jgi:hypothetical protein
MSEPNLDSPRPITVANAANPRGRWRWFKIIVGTVAGGLLVISLLGSLNSPKLEVRRIGAILATDGLGLEVLNVGTKPITISAVTVNDRVDCKVQRMSLANDPNPFPAELKVGDKIMLFSTCRIIRAAVGTDQGSTTYSFIGE